MISVIAAVFILIVIIRSIGLRANIDLILLLDFLIIVIKRLKIIRLRESPLTSNIESNNNNVKNIINKALESFIILFKIRKIIFNAVKILGEIIFINIINGLFFDYIKENNIIIT